MVASLHSGWRHLAILALFACDADKFSWRFPGHGLSRAALRTDGTGAEGFRAKLVTHFWGLRATIPSPQAPWHWTTAAPSP